MLKKNINIYFHMCLLILALSNKTNDQKYVYIDVKIIQKC